MRHASMHAPIESCACSNNLSQPWGASSDFMNPHKVNQPSRTPRRFDVQNENDDAIASVHANISKPTLKSVHACKGPAPANLERKDTNGPCARMQEDACPQQLYEHIDYYRRASNGCAPPPLTIGSHYCGPPASPNTWVDILQVFGPSNPTGRNLLTIPYD